MASKEGTVDQLRYFIGSQWSLSILSLLCWHLSGETHSKGRGDRTKFLLSSTRRAGSSVQASATDQPRLQSRGWGL